MCISNSLRIIVLRCANVFGLYTMWNVMIYLTKVWKLNVTHAAGILNLYWGLVGILPIVMKFLADAITGNYSMLLLSSLAYCFGFGFLSMSTPPVLADAIDNCSAYEPECIGDEQRILFYIALALIALGMSGQTASLTSFLDEQVGGELAIANNLLEVVLVLIVVVLLGGAIPLIKPWSLKFGVPAICIVVATIIFLSGSCSYNYVAPQGSPLTTLFRVFVAAASKIFYRLPNDPDQLYEEREIGLPLAPHTRTLRCLDKGAISLQQNHILNRQESRWRLCRVTEIEETKMFIRLIPVCMTIIICGVVSSLGDTYFIEQANHMNPKVGKLKVPTSILLWFYWLGYSAFFESALSGFRFGIPVSMIFSVLCCITAAKVEARRLHVITSHGLLDKPDERIPMTMFWMVPQFLLLGALDGLSITSFINFFSHLVPPSMRNGYFDTFLQAIRGVGVLGSILCVYVVGKISERGGSKPSWFQDILNKSRLDNYYWTLAAMGAVNLILLILIVNWWAPWDVEELPDMNDPEILVDIVNREILVGIDNGEIGPENIVIAVNAPTS